MDELGFNKIAAAILATALGFMGIKELAHAVMHHNAPASPAYALEIPEAAGAVEEIEPLAITLIMAAQTGQGQTFGMLSARPPHSTLDLVIQTRLKPLAKYGLTKAFTNILNALQNISQAQQ